jgi:alpha-1,2-mannosyltransferase
VSGNLFTPGEVARVPGQQPGRGGPAEADGERRRRLGPRFSVSRLRDYWLSNPGKVMLLATALALALRLFTLSRQGYLTGITEYDDGVYIGGSVRMTEGQLPYLNFAFIQPPGILELMMPVAIIAKVTSTVKALALARLLTALASAACIPLVGNLVRYRGAVVTAVTCGVLAVYPPDITTAHTLLLEPWMNLFCLIAMNLAFRRGHLARPARLVWAGIALGFAGDIKFWAVVPAFVLLVICLMVTKDRVRRVRAYLIGLVIGFGVPAAPFLIATPLAFIRSTILDQAARTGSYVADGVRLANLTGLIDFYTTKGQFSLHPGGNSMFAAGAAAGIGDSHSLGWLPILAAVIVTAAIATGYVRQSRRLTELEWLSLATAVLAAASVIVYSAFFYHYADFPAPWLALALGGAAGALAGHRAWSLIVVRVFALVIVLVAVLQVREMFPLTAHGAEAISHEIPAGACVVTDEASLTIGADRFANLPPGCPDIVDSLASTLVLSNGVSIQAGASKMPAVVAQWKQWLGEADYVWLSPSGGSKKRIPWDNGTNELWNWFRAHFDAVGKNSTTTGQVYRRVGYVPPAR